MTLRISLMNPSGSSSAAGDSKGPRHSTRVRISGRFPKKSPSRVHFHNPSATTTYTLQRRAARMVASPSVLKGPMRPVLLRVPSG